MRHGQILMPVQRAYWKAELEGVPIYVEVIDLKWNGDVVIRLSMENDLCSDIETTSVVRWKDGTMPLYEHARYMDSEHAY